MGLLYEQREEETLPHRVQISPENNALNTGPLYAELEELESPHSAHTKLHGHPCHQG